MSAAPAQASPSDDAGVRLRAGWVALVAGAAIGVGKLAVYALTGSTAVFSDAMESAVNVAAGVALVYSLTLSARPPDRNHPYGHGKAEYFSAGVEGALIAVAAVAIAFEAARDLLRGPELRDLDLGLVLLAGLAAANGALGAWLVRTGRRTRSLALEADGRHLFTDVVTSAGVVAALLGVRITGWSLLDPLVALGVAANILRTGWSLVRRSVGGLMDEADRERLDRLAAGLEAGREPWCIDVHGLRAWSSGPLVHVDLHVAVPRYYDADRLHDLDAALARRLLEAADSAGDVLIHFDPCRPRQCPICAVPDCPLRAAPGAGPPPLTRARATRGEEQLETGEPLPRASP